MHCPACGGKRHVETLTSGVYLCRRCQALHGTTYLGQSYALVLPGLAIEPVEPEQLRYYDLDCLGSAGVTRRHGWYDPATRLIHQIG